MTICSSHNLYQAFLHYIISNSLVHSAAFKLDLYHLTTTIHAIHILLYFLLQTKGFIPHQLALCQIPPKETAPANRTQRPQSARSTNLCTSRHLTETEMPIFQGKLSLCHSCTAAAQTHVEELDGGPTPFQCFAVHHWGQRDCEFFPLKIARHQRPGVPLGSIIGGPGSMHLTF